MARAERGTLGCFLTTMLVMVVLTWALQAHPLVAMYLDIAAQSVRHMMGWR